MTFSSLNTSLLSTNSSWDIFPTTHQKSGGSNSSDDDNDSSELLSQIRENLNPVNGNWCRVSWELLESGNAFERLFQRASPRECMIDILSTYGASLITSRQNGSPVEAFEIEYLNLENPPKNPLARAAIALDNIGLALEIHVIDIPFNRSLLPSIDNDNKLSAHPKCIYGNKGNERLPRLYLVRERDDNRNITYTPIVSGMIGCVNLLENNLFEVFTPQNAEQ